MSANNMKFLRSFEVNRKTLDAELADSFADFLLAENSLLIHHTEDPKTLLENLITVSYEVRRILDAGSRYSGLSYREALKHYQVLLQADPQVSEEEDYNDPDRIIVRQEKLVTSQLLSLIVIGFSNTFKTKGTTFDIDSKNTQINGQRVSEAVTETLSKALRELLTYR